MIDNRNNQDWLQSMKFIWLFVNLFTDEWWLTFTKFEWTLLQIPWMGMGMLIWRECFQNDDEIDYVYEIDNFVRTLTDILEGPSIWFRNIRDHESSKQSWTQVTPGTQWQISGNSAGEYVVSIIFGGFPRSLLKRNCFQPGWCVKLVRLMVAGQGFASR